MSWPELTQERWEQVSYLGSMQVIGLLTAAVVAYAAEPSLLDAAVSTGVVAVSVVAIPVAVLLYLMEREYVSDFDVSNREERFLVLLPAIVSAAGGVGVLWWLEAAAPVLAMMAVVLVLAVLVFAINLVWKISIHTTSWGGCTGVLWLLFGPVALLLLPPAVLVAESRLELDMHTRGQVVAGFVLGLAGAFLVFRLYAGV